jgi:hypothetical protein
LRDVAHEQLLHKRGFATPRILAEQELRCSQAGSTVEFSAVTGDEASAPASPHPGPIPRPS